MLEGFKENPAKRDEKFEEYLKFMKDKINKDSSEIYKYLNFDQLTDYNSKYIEIAPVS